MAKRFIGNVKGVGVSDFSWEYYLSSSSAVLDGGSWSATPPTLGNNKYLWMRSKVTLTDGTIQYTTPVCEGVWEEIYSIYAIGDKVDGALSDVTDLKSRMTAEESKVQPIAKGGTGATTAEAARENLGVKSCGTYDILPIAQGGTGKTTAAEALEALGGASFKKLWENAKPSNAFVKQTISIALSGYDAVMIENCLFNNYTDRRITQMFLVGKEGYMSQALQYIVWRMISIKSTGISFEQGQNTYQFNATSADNTACIPTRIWGVKF